MKINKGVYEEQTSIGEFEEVQSAVRQEDLGFALEAVSKNLYQNPIGSFIRELVSNGVDANIETDAQTLVKVHIYKEDDTWYFSVRDYGKGMSKEHFNNVYMNWFNSDKRDSNKKIGGWGLGSKTPLAYRDDSYELFTCHENIKRHYIIAKTDPLPTSTLVLEEETDESGTCVFFEISEKDLLTIHRECKQQLAYFNNVIVINDYTYYDNDFNVLDGGNFLYRPDAQPFPTMHIALGQVPYPINYEILDMKPVHIPIALKFDINDLPVTLSRESINYKDKNIDVINVIKTRIYEVINDLTEKYKNQVSFQDDLCGFLKYIKSDKHLKLGDFILPLDKTYIKETATLTLKGVPINIPLKVYKDNLSSLLKFFYIKSSRVTELYRGTKLDNILDTPYNYVYKDADSNHWSNKYYENKTLVNPLKITSKNILDLAYSLGLADRSYYRRNGNPYHENGLKYTFLLVNAANNLLKASLAHYSDVPQSFIDAEKAKQKELEDARKGSITVYSCTGTMSNIKVEDLYKDYDYIFYISRKDDFEKIVYYNFIFSSFPKYFKKKLKFIIINPTTIKTIKKIDKFKSVENIWKYKTLSNHFNRLVIGCNLINLDLSFTNDNTTIYYHRLFVAVYDRYCANLGGIPDFLRGYDLETKQVSSIPNKFTTYFKDELERKHTDKYFMYSEYVDELSKVKDFLNAYKVISRSGDSKRHAAIKYLIKMSKILKLKY